MKANLPQYRPKNIKHSAQDEAGDLDLVQSEQASGGKGKCLGQTLWARKGLLVGMNLQKDEIQLLLWRYFLFPSQTPFSAQPGNCSRPTRSRS